MSYGPVKIFAGTIASAASTLTSLNLSKSWSKVYLQLPTFSTAAQLAVFGSTDNSTFYPLIERVATVPPQFQSYTVGTGVASSGGIIQLDTPMQYLQFRASAVVDNGVALNAICVD